MKWSLAIVAAGALGMSLLAIPCPAKEKKKAPAAQAVLAGTVFRDSGFSLRGAEIVVTAESDGPSKRKPAEWRAVSDARGEFALRLPAGPGRYNVVVRASGYRPQEKKVVFGGDERLDFTFLLEPGGEKK